ncbi:hypothetical protein HHI36_014347 [Cryptolaemus montrouzieri]|uniref:Ionotropic receptor n=1 Tax=Cryptolaemus montrouzieri TaxID=559131 RepID=A0ABD2N315_9CUCU
MNLSLFNSLPLIASQCISLTLINISMEKDAFISVSSNKYFLDFASIRVNYRNKMLSNWFPTKPDFYIIDEDNLDNLLDIFRELSDLSTLSFNPRAKYLFIGQNFTIEFLKFISALYIRDVLFLNPETLDFGPPFHQDTEQFNCAKIHYRIICENSTLKRNNADLSPRKIEQYLGITTISAVYKPVEMYSTCHNCTFKGILLEMFEIIAAYLEIKVEYYQHVNLSNQDIFKNYNVYIRVYGREVLSFTELTMSCLAEEMSWFVPTPKLIPRWKYLNNIFKPSVWLAFFAIIFIISLVWGTSNLIFEGEFIFSEIVIAVFKQFLEQDHNIPKNYVNRAILAVSILFLTYLMNTFLKCRFTYLLNGINYQNELNSFEDIVSARIRIGSTPVLIQLLNTTPQMSDHLEKYYLVCELGPDCLKRIAFRKDMAVLKPGRKVRAFMKMLIEEKGEILMKEIKPPFFVLHMALHFQRGHPLFHSFNKQLYNLVETGIAEKIISGYDHQLEEVLDIYIEQRALTTEHLVIPLFIWIFGILSALIIFGVEEILQRKGI